MTDKQLQTIYNNILENCDPNVKEISDSDSLFDDLKMDELDLITSIIELETIFGVFVEVENPLDEIKTVSDMVKAFEGVLK